jgi:hypothetical protein
MEDKRTSPCRNPVPVAWMSVQNIYHHVLARSPSPEAAKIEISTARMRGQLPLFAERREHKAQPGIRLQPGQKSPQPEPDTDCPLPYGGFNHWDWERAYATRRDGKTKSLFEYVNIHGRRDDVLRLWPELAPRGLVPVIVQQLNAIAQEREPGLAGLRQKDLMAMVETRLGRPISLRSVQSAVAICRRNIR